MTDKERLEKFRNGKIAVNCPTEKEAIEFIEWCYINDMKWNFGEELLTYFYIHEEQTCYSYHKDIEQLYCSQKSYLFAERIPIMTYKEFMKKDDNKITNLEWILNNVDKEVMKFHPICVIARDYIEKEDKCIGKNCLNCKFYDTHYLLKFLQKKYKEKHIDPIKLSQFEYDLLRTNDQSHDRKLSSFATYKNMKELGYFKNVDFELTIKQVLDDCEVV